MLDGDHSRRVGVDPAGWFSLDRSSCEDHCRFMSIGAPKSISECRRFFMEPASAKQRQYEAFRAFFVEDRQSSEVARAFGYTPASFQVMCHHFRREPQPEF